MKNYLALISLLLCISCAVSSYNSLHPSKRNFNPYSKEKAKPIISGKCFVKAYRTDSALQAFDTVYHYKNIDSIEHTQQKFITQEAGQKWVKMKANRNCISSDPNDCLVWCLKTVEEEFYIKKTPVNISEAELVWSEPIYFSSDFDWLEVVCKEDITEELFDQLKIKFIALGYQDENTTLSKQRLENNIKRYQTENRLYKSDGITLELLDHLEIEY